LNVRISRRRARLLGLTVGLVGTLLMPSLVAAHPLGNFTINHYAGIRVEPDRVLLDVVIDQAEIPTFQARLDFDADGDGDVSDAEADAGRVAACQQVAPSLGLVVAGRRIALSLTEAGLSFPPGAGGLFTMRVVCGFEGRLSDEIASGTTITFEDSAFTDRIGWREIVAEGSGVTIEADHGDPRTTGVSARLTRYPADLLTSALADWALAITVSPGGAILPPFSIPDADPVPGADTAPTAAPKAASTAAPTLTVVGRIGAVSEAAAPIPGGVSGGDLPSIFRTADLSPIVLLISLMTAVVLGAGHALTPGHGKTLMAAYLVGTRGTPVHAVGLGLSVTLSHTIGILVLAALIVGAEGLLSPDVVVRSAPVVAAVSILAIGGWMLVGEGRRRSRIRAAAAAHADAHPQDEAHDHAERDAHADHDSQDDHEHGHEGDRALGDTTHTHGGVPHSHLPVAGSTITWRSLFVLGLAGGLIPSTSALLILLGSIAAGRPAFGLVLVIAFGLGMALVMAGIGLALVLARGRLDGVDAASPLGRVSGLVPLVASVLVFGLGLYLTFQAVAGTTTL
jgi:nickel/cobalt exporter